MIAAVIHEAGSLGQRSELTRLSYYDAAGEPVGETIEFPRKIQWVQRLHWHGDQLLAAAAFAGGSYGVLIISPDDGSVREVPIEQHVFTWKLVGPTEDGELYVFRVRDGVSAKSQESPPFVLQRLDVARGTLDPPVLEESGIPSFAGRWISPSGRYWLRALGKIGEGMKIVEIESGEELPLDECRRARWLADDRFVCLERLGSGMRLTVGAPGEQREELIAREASTLVFEVSPNRRHLLVQIWDTPPRFAEEEEEEESDDTEHMRGLVVVDGEYWGTGARLVEVRLFEEGTAPAVDLDGKLGLPDEQPGTHLRWADADTLAVVGRSRLGFLDIGTQDGPRYAFGGP
jgi:hypothetical protein